MKSRRNYRRRKIEIKKSSGQYEVFSSKKLLNSLRFAGLNRGRAERIVREIKRDIRPGDTTKDIYRRAYNLVRKESLSSFFLSGSLTQ
jgi:transcriptional regulator NrdR family protein